MPTGVLFLPLRDIRRAMPNSQEMTSKTMRLSPCVVCVQSTGARVPVQRLYPVSEGLSHLHTVRVPLWCVVAKSPFRRSLHHPSFFLFFLFCLQSCFSNSSPQNRFSSKIAIKSLWKFMSIVAAIASRLLLSCSRRRASSLCWSSGFCVAG